MKAAKGNRAGFFRRHKHAEEAIAEAAGIDLLWVILRRAGILGATAAMAATATVLTQNSQTYHPPYSLSVKGAAFIARYEGLRTVPYNDPFNCTTGVGHLIRYGRCTQADYRQWAVTVPQAYTLLMHDAATAEGYVRRNVTRPIDQPQFDALVSFTFNVGGGGLEQSSVLRDVNDGNYQDITRAFAVWSYANGVRFQGLYYRRLAEARLFLVGDYGPGIGIYTPPKPVPALKTSRRLYFYTGTPASMRVRAATVKAAT